MLGIWIGRPWWAQGYSTTPSARALVSVRLHGTRTVVTLRVNADNER